METLEPEMARPNDTTELWKEKEESNFNTHIANIPEEVLELIFGHLSPYGDLKNVMLVCKQWHRVVSDLILKLQRNFHQRLRCSQMIWSFVSSHQAPTITDRFSHSACYFQQSMYVFGGCSATSTTFNDLWRFDLATRQWARPVASGTYPSPKACASMVVYKDSLVLYGGWSRPTPLPLHQAPRYFSELHMYTPSTNRWSQITAVSNDALHRVAGHSASIVEDTMVVFGGSHDTGTGCNEVWLFDFQESAWKKPVITGKLPNPRYGQSQKTLDTEHIMVVGGCGGPNQMFSDVWLLHLINDTGTWEEIIVENPEFAPPAIWCHPACMVDGLAVFISKNNRTVKASNSEPRNQQPQPNRVWIPPQGNAAQPPEAAHNGAVAVLHHNIPPPPSFLPMAAFQRRREDWAAGGLGMLGVLPLPPRGPPDVLQHNFHGAHNPNIHDVQRLRVHGRQLAGLRGEIRSGLQGPQLPGPQHFVYSPVLNPQGATMEHEAGPSRQGIHGSTFHNVNNGSNHATGSIERPACTSSGMTRESCLDLQLPRPVNASMNSPSADSDSDSDAYPDPETSGAHALRPGFPSVRPNAMHNRQRQLDMLRKHENRLRSRSNINNSHNRTNSLRNSDILPRNPMVIHVLDFSDVISTRTVSWLPTKDTFTPGAPEETIFYSLVEGRGELILFGGIQRDQNPMQRVNSPPDSGFHIVSSGLFILSPQWFKCV